MRYMQGVLQLGLVGAVCASVAGVGPECSDFIFAVRGDGSFVAVQAIDYGLKLNIARFSSDGATDLSFGGGTVTTPFACAVQPRTVLLQSDGSVIVMGNYDCGLLRQDIILVRYTADGRLDQTFAHGRGYVLCTEFPVSEACALHADPVGRLTIAGRCFDEREQSTFFVVRYLSDGSADESFGVHGVLRVRGAW